MDFNIPLSTGQSVLMLHFGPDGAESQEILKCSDKFRGSVGSTGGVRIATSSELGTLSASSYDVVCTVDSVQLTQLDLPAILHILRPDGILWMSQLAVQSSASSKPTTDSVISTLTLGGFVKPHAKVGSQSLASEAAESDDISKSMVFHICAYKPSYEVGSSLPIKLSAKKSAVTAWSLAATDMVDDLDIIDSDTVLDADDLKKPDTASLRTCGVSDGAVQRKACKNCTCGLAEQLNEQNEQEQPAKTSSCGNCYLGDAFRCAGCPYRGMPAFKPGEKVQLPMLSMQDDV